MEVIAVHMVWVNYSCHCKFSVQFIQVIVIIIEGLRERTAYVSQL